MFVCRQLINIRPPARVSPSRSGWSYFAELAGLVGVMTVLWLISIAFDG